MFGWFKKKEEMPSAPVVQLEQPKPKKPRKPKVKKEKAPKIEPKVEVLKFDFDPANPRLGSIELDWNKEFVELLVKHGYKGPTAEDIVDAWLNDVCKTIVENQYQGSNVSASVMNSVFVTKKPIGDGKVEVK